MTSSPESASRKPDRWTWTLSVLLVMLWAAVLAVLLTPQVPNGHGFEHSRFPTMDQAGDGTYRHGHLLLVGWLLGSVVIATFVSLLACGTVRGRSADYWRLAVFLCAGLLYEGVFGMMCYSYRDSLNQPHAVFSGLFPQPLSWLLFGIWLVPGFFVVLYVAFFYSWVWPADNARRFSELVANSSRTNESHEPETLSRDR